jgi:hypothetical protein
MSVPQPRPGEIPAALSASTWVDDALRGALARAIPAILGPAASFRPRCLLLTGSASLGEAVGWEGGDDSERLVLSDLDLGLVTADRIPPAARRVIQAAARAAGWQEPYPVETPLGFYESAWWSRQVPTLGMVDARDRARVAWGDPAIPARLSVPSPGRIPAWEAVRLAGNRALELLAAPGPRDAPRLRPRGWFALAKAVTGLWTARLVLEGRYRTGWAERRAVLEVEGRPGDPVADAARAWAPFLAAPSFRNLPEGGAGLGGYRAALSHWFATLPSELCAVGETPEAAFLREPVTLRHRLRAWRAEGRGAGGGLAAGTGVLAAGRIPWRAGTPEGRRMAAACVYWLDLPERPEPAWGAVTDDPAPGRPWEPAMRDLLGVTLRAGPGCRDRLRAALRVEAGTGPGSAEEANG